ncbi:MAG: hypothetical protein ABSG03_19125 [Bryobacteraceae bacterium]|jgi:hypothetical protein
MRSDYLPDDLKKLWKELALNPVRVSAEDLRRESCKLRTGLGLRSWFVVGVGCIIIATYGLFFFFSKTALERIGSMISIAGAANVIVQFLRRPARTMPESDAIESIRFYRAELERHRDFHRGRGIGSWLLPVLHGPIIFNVAFALDRPIFAPIVELPMAILLMTAAIVVPLNLGMARKYSAESMRWMNRKDDEFPLTLTNVTRKPRRCTVARCPLELLATHVFGLPSTALAVSRRLGHWAPKSTLI